MKKKNNKVIVFFNILLFFILVCFAFVLFNIYFVKNNENEKPNYYSINNLKDNDTKYNNELPKEKIKKIEKKIEVPVDPEYKIAMESFESAVNYKLNTFFIKPFNFKEGSSCFLDVNMSKNKYKVYNCVPDKILKREVELALEKMKPFKTKTYNNIKINEKDITLKLKLN